MVQSIEDGFQKKKMERSVLVMLDYSKAYEKVFSRRWTHSPTKKSPSSKGLPKLNWRLHPNPRSQEEAGQRPLACISIACLETKQRENSSKSSESIRAALHVGTLVPAQHAAGSNPTNYSIFSLPKTRRIQ